MPHAYTAKSRTRDARRRPCYRWGDILRNKYTWLRGPLELADAQHIANTVWSHYAEAAGHDPTSTVTVKRYYARGGRTFGDACYATLTIRLRKDSGLETLLHELAHLVCGYALVGGPHGPVFCRLLAEFLDEYAGLPSAIARHCAPRGCAFLTTHPFPAGAPKSPRQAQEVTL